MTTRRSASDIYAVRGSSIFQRAAITAVLGVSACAVWWLLLFGGLRPVGALVGQTWRSGDETRRVLLVSALTIYFTRLLFTQFVFLKRNIRWGEALMISAWAAFIYLLVAVRGGTNPAPEHLIGFFGVILFLAGSWMNTYAEYQRHVWKLRPENRDHLFTGGLFRYSRHPNYLGDLISFSGLCMISGRPITIVIPLIMLSGFVFANIPLLDSHLHSHYGAEFDQYAARTHKLIPFLY